MTKRFARLFSLGAILLLPSLMIASLSDSGRSWAAEDEQISTTSLYVTRARLYPSRGSSINGYLVLRLFVDDNPTGGHLEKLLTSNTVRFSVQDGSGASRIEAQLSNCIATADRGRINCRSDDHRIVAHFKELAFHHVWEREKTYKAYILVNRLPLNVIARESLPPVTVTLSQGRVVNEEGILLQEAVTRIDQIGDHAPSPCKQRKGSLRCNEPYVWQLYLN